jgi:hypothetical protein
MVGGGGRGVKGVRVDLALVGGIPAVDFHRTIKIAAGRENGPESLDGPILRLGFGPG